MGMEVWRPLLIAGSTADGTALTNTTTGASIIEPQARQLIPGGLLGRIGAKLRLEAEGRISTVVTTPGTLTFEFRMGPTSNIIAATTTAFPLNIVAKTNITWRLVWDLELRTVGISTSATLLHTAQWITEAYIGANTMATNGCGVAISPSSAPAVGTGWDSTVGNVADLQADWSVANAANSIQCHMYRLWALNVVTG